MHFFLYIFYAVIIYFFVLFLIVYSIHRSYDYDKNIIRKINNLNKLKVDLKNYRKSLRLTRLKINLYFKSTKLMEYKNLIKEKKDYIKKISLLKNEIAQCEYNDIMD